MAEHDVLVRAAQADEADTIADFNQAMALETEGRTLPDERIRPGVRAVFEDASRGRYFVAERGGVVVACLLITYEWSDWRNGLFWWIQSVFVDQAHRGTGVFRTLYAEVRRLALAEGGVAGLRLYVEQDNVNAQRTYLALGMERTHYQLFEEEFTR